MSNAFSLDSLRFGVYTSPLVHNPKAFWGMGVFGDTPNPARVASPPGPPIPTTSRVSALGRQWETMSFPNPFEGIETKQNIRRIAVLLWCLVGLVWGLQWQTSVVRADGPQVKMTRPLSANGNVQGHAGTRLTITGNGFPANATVALYTTTNGDAGNCNANGDPATLGLNQFASAPTVQVRDNGRFTVTSTWPDNASTPATPYYICAISQAQQGQQPLSALSSNTFTVVGAATLDVQPATITAGGQVTITGTNWLPPQLLILTLTADNNNEQPLRRITINPDQQGNFTRMLTIPKNANAQAYTIRVISNDQNTQLTKPLTVSTQTAVPPTVVPSPKAISSTPTATTSSPTPSTTIGGFNGITLLSFMLGGIGVVLVIVGVIMFFVFAK